MIEKQVLSVSQLNSYIKQVIEKDRTLISVTIRGELSNYKMHSSGHHYFSLKDSESVLRCVMFRNHASRLRFLPENGMKVLVMGSISVYVRDGSYQLYCTAILPDGFGDLQVAFEQMKKRLQEEGLFDASFKKELPAFPNRIALVTSPTGAAVQDMLRILNNRWALSEILIAPTLVQGPDAPVNIAEAIRYLNDYSLADLIIVGRGGGSLEDLWAFNTEIVARAVFASEIPVISAVGHEPDMTIADYVSDLRAATPSNAAELAVPDNKEIRSFIHSSFQRMTNQVNLVLGRLRDELERNQTALLSLPESAFQRYQMDMDYFADSLHDSISIKLNDCRNAHQALARAYQALDPHRILSRGYSIVAKDQEPIISVNEVTVNDRINVFLSDGKLDCQILRISYQE